MTETLDIEAAPEPTDAERAQCAELALLLREQEKEVIRRTAALQLALEALRRTREVDLPDAMRAAQQAEFKLLDGTPVRLEDRYDAKVLKSDENPAGIAYVVEHQGASMIKCLVVVEFDRDDRAAAQELAARVRRESNEAKRVELTESVHQSTLAAWVRTLVEEGQDPPLETLGAYRTTRARVGTRLPKTVELKGLAAR